MTNLTCKNQVHHASTKDFGHLNLGLLFLRYQLGDKKTAACKISISILATVYFCRSRKTRTKSNN